MEMQPQDESGECAETGAGDGGWNAEQRTLEGALRLAFALLLDLVDRPVCVEPNSTVNLSTTLKGSGGTNA